MSSITSTSMSDSSGCFPSPLKWEDCDTICKIAGFIIGEGIRCIGKGAYQVIHLLYWDKITEFASYFFKQIKNKIFSPLFRICDTALNSIQTIFRGIECVVSHIHQYVITPINYVLTPIGRLIKTIAKFFFQTLLLERICKPCWNRIVIPIYHKVKAFVPHFSTEKKSIIKENNGTCKTILTGSKIVGQWTCDFILNPCFSALCDLTHGIFSGAFGKDQETPETKADTDYFDHNGDENLLP